MRSDQIVHDNRATVDLHSTQVRRTTPGVNVDHISIVIPAYNEEARIGPTLDSVALFLGSHEFTAVEVIVVDDGSSDHTAQYVERFALEQPAVRLLRNSSNKGKGYSVRRGMLEAKGQWILCTDADLSTPLDEATKLFEAAFEQDAAIAIGSRAIDSSLIGKRQSYFREISGRIFNRAMRLLTGLAYRDTQCGFKVFRADAARDIFASQQLDGFSFDVESLYLAERLGFRTVEVPVRWNNAEGTKVSGLSGLKSFVDLMRIRFYHQR